MATTTNYGWTTPNDTDLVKDGAAAIRTLGSSIDTTTKALNPSTTLGDIEYRSATANTNTRLPIGTSGQVLTVNGSGVPTWATGGAPATSYALINTGGTALTGAASITVSGLSGYNKLMVLITDSSSASASSDFSWRLNGDSGASVYRYAAVGLTAASTYAPGNQGVGYSQGDQIYFAKMSANAASTISGGLVIDGANSSGLKILTSMAGGSQGGSNGHQQQMISGIYTGTSVISSVTVLSTAGNFDNGTLFVYGA